MPRGNAHELLAYNHRLSSLSLLARTAKSHRHRGADASLYPIPLTPQALTNPLAFPGGSVVKNPPADAGDARDASLIPGLGRSPGGASNNPLQYSYLKNSMGRGAWCAAVHGIAESRTWLSTQHTHTHTHRPQGVYANEVTLGGKRSGVWNVSSGPQEQGLLVKQVPRVWPGGGWGLVSKTLFFFLTIYFCFAESLCCTWAFSRFLMMLLSLQTMD